MLSIRMLGVGCAAALLAFRLVPARPVNLEDQDLSDAVLPHRQWVRGRLANADLARADLTGSDLQGANLRKSCLVCACLRKVNLSHADLRRADLWGADFTGANLDAAIYNRKTRWPAGFRVEGTGARCIADFPIRR